MGPALPAAGRLPRHETTHLAAPQEQKPEAPESRRNLLAG